MNAQWVALDTLGAERGAYDCAAEALQDAGRHSNEHPEDPIWVVNVARGVRPLEDPAYD